MTTTTTNYGWEKPDIGSSDDDWGRLLNLCIDHIDTAVKAALDAGTAAQSSANAASAAAAVDATTGGKGRVQLATAAEVSAGTDTAKAVTPSTLGGLRSLTGNGYYVLPGGLIVNWAKVSCTGNASATMSWAKPFTSACFAAVATAQNSGMNVSNWGVIVGSPTTAGCTVGRVYPGGTNESNLVHVIAVGV